MTSAQGITFEPRPSASLTTLLCFVMLAGTVAPWPTSLPLAARTCLSLAALAFGLWRVRVHRRPALKAVQWHPEGAWIAIDANGAPHAAEPRSIRVVGEWVCLRLFWHGGRASLILGPDNVDPETLRILRIRLNQPM